MKLFLHICRVLVGTLFIISGMIKANDPMGFSYKMEEYFTVFKLTETRMDTTYTQRDLTPEEVTAVLEGKSTLKPTDYAGNPIDLSVPGVENEFMYVNEPTVSESASEKEHWFNDFCDFMYGKALALSVLVCVVEILLGAMLLLGVFIPFTAVMLFLMILFFGFLTFYSAWFNKVTDCGCFGDALKLTPWQSFWKDVILGLFILPVLFFGKRMESDKFDLHEIWVSAVASIGGLLVSGLVFHWYLPGFFILVLVLVRIVAHFSLKKQMMKNAVLIIVPLILSGWFTAHCYNHLPVKDYRPWAIGNIITEKMKGEPEFANVYMIYKNSKTGEVKEYLAIKNTDGNPINDFSWMTEQFLAENEFVNQRKEIVKPYVEAPIHDFTLESKETGEEYAMDFVKKPGLKFMLVAYDLTKTNTAVQPKVNALAAEAQKAGMEFIGATASGDLVEDFRHQHQNGFTYYVNDATSLKTIIRSNPGLVLIKDTLVLDMWHYNDFPSFEEIRKKHID
jgi:uncharacterized membrane protein YphA (DoxX/SURF4 family)